MPVCVFLRVYVCMDEMLLGWVSLWREGEGQMLLKNSPWAAGVHSLSTVRPWGQAGREGGRWRERWGARKETADGCKKEKCGKIGWDMSGMQRESDKRERGGGDKNDTYLWGKSPRERRKEDFKIQRWQRKGELTSQQKREKMERASKSQLWMLQRSD